MSVSYTDFVLSAHQLWYFWAHPTAYSKRIRKTSKKLEEFVHYQPTKNETQTSKLTESQNVGSISEIKKRLDDYTLQLHWTFIFKQLCQFYDSNNIKMPFPRKDLEGNLNFKVWKIFSQTNESEKEYYYLIHYINRVWEISLFIDSS